MVTTVVYKTHGLGVGKIVRRHLTKSGPCVNRDSASSIKGLRVASLGAVVTHKVRIITVYSFDVHAARGEEGRLNKDTHTEEVPKRLRRQALPITGANRSPHKVASKTNLLSKADVTDVFRNVSVTPRQAQNFCHMVHDVLVSDFRLTFGYAASPGSHGLSGRTRSL